MFYQNSTEKREDILWVEGRSIKRTHYETISADQLKPAIKKRDNYDDLVEAGWIAEFTNKYYSYYYELSDGRFIGCDYIGDKVERLFMVDLDGELYCIYDER